MQGFARNAIHSASDTEVGEVNVADRPKVGIASIAHSLRTRDMAPFNSDEWIIFGLNNVHRYIPGGSLWMQIHTPEYLASHPAYTDEDRKFYETLQIPLFAQKHYAHWPTSLPLPIEEMEAKWPRMPWNSTMAYMLGVSLLMIDKGEFPAPLNQHAVPDKRVAFYGFDTLDDYSEQGAPMAYLVSYAENVMGVEVVIPKGSGFLRQPYRYGYEDKEARKRRTAALARREEIKLLQKQLTGKYETFKQNADHLQRRLDALQGAREEVEGWVKNWVPEDLELQPLTDRAILDPSAKEKTNLPRSFAGNKVVAEE